MTDRVNAPGPGGKPVKVKAIYVGKISPWAGRAKVGQMHATPAARAIQHEQSLASKARRHYKKK